MSTKVSLPPEQKTLPSLGDLLSSTLSLVAGNASFYFGYAGWMLVPLAGLVLLRITLGTTPVAEQLVFVLNGLSLVLYAWVYAHLVATTAGLKQFQQPIAAPISYLRVFFVLLVYGLMVGIGIPLLLVPGVLCMTWFAYAPAIAILERGGFVSSFLASKALVDGMFWQTCTRLLGIFLPTAFVYLALSLLLALIYPELLSLNPQNSIPLLVDLVLSLAQIALLPFVVTAVTLLYLARKNG